ncbi:hypothetical protein Tco_0011058 [Tanacetum coccineum]
MDSNCVNNSGQNCPDNVSRQNSPANIGHKFTGIGNSIGSRRSHTTDRKTLPHVPSASIVGSMNAQPKGISSYYIDIGDCDCSCEHCDAKFWYGERLKGCSTDRENRRFMENIRACNQMFIMTSFGARADDSINNGWAPYVFKISWEVYHWIGSLCPTEGDPPRFLQLYIYDTENEVANRMRHFGGASSGILDSAIVQGLIGFLDKHNELVRLFRIAGINV